MVGLGMLQKWYGRKGQGNGWEGNGREYIKLVKSNIPTLYSKLVCT